MSHRNVATRCRDIALKLANWGTVVARIVDAYTRPRDNRHKKFFWAREDSEPVTVDVRRYVRSVQASSEFRAGTLVRLIALEWRQTNAAKRSKIPSNIVIAYARNWIIRAG